MGDKISFSTLGLSSTITRPANATPYTINDVLAAVTTSAPFVLGTAYTETTARTTPNIAPLRGTSSDDGRSVVVQSLKMVSSQSTSAPMDLVLYAFSKAITFIADNTEFAPSLANMQDYYMGRIAVPYYQWMQYDNCNEVFIPNLDTVLTFPEPSNYTDVTGQIWLFPVLKNAYTPASGEVIKLTANIVRD